MEKVGSASGHPVQAVAKRKLGEVANSSAEELFFKYTYGRLMWGYEADQTEVKIFDEIKSSYDDKI